MEVTVEPVPERISFVGQATANANWTSHTVTVPAGVQAGDMLLLLLSQNTHTGTGEPTGVTGWSRLDRLDGGFATTTAWWKTAGAGDAGTAVRVTLDSQAKGNLVLAAYRGVAPGAPVFTRATDPASTATRITPYAPVTTAQSWAVSYWLHGDSTSTALTPPSGVAVRSTAVSRCRPSSGTLGTGAAVGGGGAGPLGQSISWYVV